MLTERWHRTRKAGENGGDIKSTTTVHRQNNGGGIHDCKDPLGSIKNATIFAAAAIGVCFGLYMHSEMLADERAISGTK